jgi:hypothetical protein
MAQGGETYGRYCLPAREAPPLAAHPAWFPVSAAFLLADLAMLAVDTGLVRVGHVAHAAVEFLFLLSGAVLLGTWVWIRRAQRRADDHPH